MNEEWTIEDVLEGWIADRTISRRKRAFLKQMHDINVSSDSEPLICPNHISSELDLPDGSSWPDVLANFLDFIEGQKVGHKVLDHQMELGSAGSMSNDDFDDIDDYVMTLDSIMETWIGKGRITKRQLTFLEELFQMGLNILRNTERPNKDFKARVHWLNHLPVLEEDIREDCGCLDDVCIASLLDFLNPIKNNKISRIKLVRAEMKRLYPPVIEYSQMDYDHMR